MKFKTIVIFVSFVLLSNFILSSDLREGMTAPLPPKFEPIPFDVDFARNFLQKMIMVKFVLGEDSEIKIEQDWEMIILNEKRKDQKENNTINNKNNAKIWIQEAYGKMIKFLTVNRKAQKKFEILCYPYIKKYPELETSASLKVLFFKKQYTNFLQSDVLKNVMFDFGMNVLGYTNTMISGDEHPVGGHNEKKSTVVKKSAEDRAKNEKEYAEIDALEKKMLKQEQQIDAFEILIDEHSDRSNVVSEYHTKIQEIIEQMKKEKAQLDALKIEVAKEIVEPEYHKKVSGWSTMTNEKAVEILTASVLDEKKAVEAAQVLLDVNKSFSPAEIEQAVVEEKQEIAQMQDAEQQEKYTQALTVAEKVLKEQVVLSDIVDQPISDEFRVAIQKDGINIAQDLLKKGKNINEMMDESNFANVDWSDQQIAYAMGYVQSCMNILQQIATKHSVFSIIRVVEILKNINSAVSQVHG